ncbi:RHS repeat-associated core domain-containing protein [Senna tora]|uniref:RHS repeat-associated core domain-containing protein n=1 Tax=Senna tora TaxID=362788 RepID=A0A834WZ00_9FABA|nr:RHS repeat-associated core domain-containing protein [Senna tora]
MVLMLPLESSSHGTSVDHVLTYFGRQIAVGSLKPSRITRQKNCCASESNKSVHVVFANGSGFDAPIGVVLAWEDSVDHVSTYSGRQIAVGSHKPSRITRQKTCCASKSNTSVRVVFANGCGFVAPIGVVLAWDERGSSLNIFRTTNRGRISETFMNYEAKDVLRNSFVFANRSGFDAPIGVVLAWEEHGSCLNIFQTPNHGRISETITNYEAKDLLRNESNTSVRIVFANRSGFDAPIGVVLAWEERGSCLNIFRMTNRGRILEIFTNYEAKYLLRNESNTSVRVVFANQSGFDAPIGVVLAWEELGSCPNIFRTTNRGRISETFTSYEAKDMLRKKSYELRGKRLVAQVSQTRRFANRSGFDAPIGVVLAWEERGSCLNIFRTKNRGRISETFTNYEAKDSLRKRQITVESQKPSRITRQKTCCANLRNLHELRGKRLVAQVSQTRRFANESGFDAPIGVVFAWEERGSCLNIFRTKNRGQISETFTNYEAKDLLRK